MSTITRESADVLRLIEQRGFPIGGIAMWAGAVTNIPRGWALCDGNEGRPNLMDKFIMGAGFTHQPGETGGYADAIVVAHSHTVAPHSHSLSDPGHAHTYQIGEGGGGGPAVNGTSNIGQMSVNSNTTGITIAEASTNAESTGEDPVGKNLPPYYALCYIIKLDPAAYVDTPPVVVSVDPAVSGTTLGEVTFTASVATPGVYYMGDGKPEIPGTPYVPPVLGEDGVTIITPEVPEVPTVPAVPETVIQTETGNTTFTYAEVGTYTVRFVDTVGEVTMDVEVPPPVPLVISGTNAVDYVVNFTVAPAVSGTFYMGDAVAEIPEVPESTNPDTGEVIPAVPAVPAIPETVIESTDGTATHTFRDGAAYTVTYSRPDVAAYSAGTLSVSPVSRFGVTLTATPVADGTFVVNFAVDPAISGTYAYGNPDGTTGTEPTFTYVDGTEVTVTFTPDDQATYVSSVSTTVVPS